MTLRQIITRNLLNIPGWHTKRKIVVIESDDWGSIRMPSKEVYGQFIKKGIRVDRNPYCKYDSLARPDDLTALYEVLTSVKDKNGNPAVLTANTIVANPDFDKIKASNFESYYYEPFTDTLKQEKATEKSFQLWQEGIRAGVFHPQFHGREHLNVKKWLRDLQKGHEVMLTAFGLRAFGLEPRVHNTINGSYMGAFDSGLDEDIKCYRKAIKEGLDLFYYHFSYQSLSFIPTTYTWHPDIEPTLYESGVKYLQGMVVQRIPIGFESGMKYKRNNFTGFQSKAGLRYITRNAYFEPSQSGDLDCVEDCMNRIGIAFRWNKPAVISMHRLNVIGAIHEENRTKNLELLKTLLNRIVTKYPDVEFMSTDRLGNLMTQNKINL